MKYLKLIFSVLLFSLATSTYAQEASTEHMKFMGLEITGPVTDFANKLKQKGFVHVETSHATVSMKGTFTGQSVEVYLVFTPSTKNIWKVSVYYPESSSWSSIKYDFNKLKDQYTSKYGSPESDYHFFEDPYYEGDNYEMQAVRLDKCHYATFWTIPTGSIMIQISKFKQIKISYEDKDGADKNEIIKGQNVMNDI